MSEIKTSKEISEVIEKIDKFNLGQISELVDNLKARYNIQETAVVQSVAAPAASEKAEGEGGNVSIKVTEIKKDKGLSIIKIYGIIKDLVNELKGEGQINVVQAKKLAEEGERIIVDKVAREKAQTAKKKLNEAGVEVELKEVK